MYDNDCLCVTPTLGSRVVTGVTSFVLRHNQTDGHIYHWQLAHLLTYLDLIASCLLTIAQQVYILAFESLFAREI